MEDAHPEHVHRERAQGSRRDGHACENESVRRDAVQAASEELDELVEHDQAAGREDRLVEAGAHLREVAFATNREEPLHEEVGEDAVGGALQGEPSDGPRSELQDVGLPGEEGGGRSQDEGENDLVLLQLLGGRHLFSGRWEFLEHSLFPQIYNIFFRIRQLYGTYKRGNRRAHDARDGPRGRS